LISESYEKDSYPYQFYCPSGTNDEESTYKHILVCYLEYQAVDLSGVGKCQPEMDDADQELERRR
jgi:hypothetical protein